MATMTTMDEEEWAARRAAELQDDDAAWHPMQLHMDCMCAHLPTRYAPPMAERRCFCPVLAPVVD